MTREEWLEYGLVHSWIGPPVCFTHDGLPMTEDEDEEFQEYDPCIFIHRVYEDYDHQLSVEKNHGPSIWRR